MSIVKTRKKAAKVVKGASRKRGENHRKEMRLMEILLKLEGELDHHSADVMREKLDREILSSGADTVIFDLSGLTFMDSSGIGVLLGRYKLFATRKLYVTGASGSVARLLKLSGIESLMPEYRGGEAI